MLRKATDRIIKLDYRTIVLVPHADTKTPSGAVKKTAGIPRDAQTFSITPMDDQIVSTESGAKAQQWKYILVGRYNAIIEIGDSWEDGNMTYEVVSIFPSNDYEKRCVVRAFGMEPNYGQ